MHGIESTGARKRMLRVVLLLAAVLGIGLGYLCLVRFLGFGIPCVLHELTGLRCPGCGLTSAFVALSHGDLHGAWSSNPMLPLYGLYGLWYGGWGTVRYVRGTKDPFLFGPGWIHILMLAAVLLFGILRNI